MMTLSRLTRLTSILILLALLNQACSLPQFTLPDISSPAPATQSPYERLPETTIYFHVQIPMDTPVGEHVYLSVLDEVTGLALNAQSYEMKAIDDHNFKLDLTFPLGAVVKYRYSRQGTYLAGEHNSNKRPVRYRLYHVEGPGTVQDIVSVWSDTAFNSPVGRIIGHVVDSQTEAPVPGILISVGGASTLTASDGSFLLEGLPPGTHNLVAYALDGSYNVFQQGARVAADSATPAEIRLSPAPVVSVTFNVVVPSGTMPAIPIRIAGNIYQLGNTFADLTGGISTLASRMPVMTPQPDGHYTLKLTLPSGCNIAYKYTLGDGFWNAEHTNGGEFRIRHIIVPETDTVINDKVDSWGSYTSGPILFQVNIPQSTPATDFVSIQFNPYGWTEPMPMWSLGNDSWAYVLYSPLDLFQRIGYRYCRDDQCGSADDSATPGGTSYGRILEITPGPKTIQDQVTSWNWYQEDLAPATVAATSIQTRGSNFFAGVELQPAYDPSWTPSQSRTFQDIQNLGANWVVLTPTWTYTRRVQPILEPVAGSDPLIADVTAEIEQAQAHHLQVALFPTPQFMSDEAEWWTTSPRDFAWWVTWFDRYRNFILNFADLAQKQGINALILGGDWIDPALPGGVLTNGQPSGVPGDADGRWHSLLQEVRAHYQGALYWARPLTNDLNNVPDFANDLDGVYLLWSARLSDRNDAQEPELQATVSRLMDEVIKPFQDKLAKPVVIAAAYPSADGGITGCLPDPLSDNINGCLNFAQLSRPNPDIPSISLDLVEQTEVYNALLAAINERDFIYGFVTRGYYPPAVLHDKSISIHGKPAGNVLWYWYPRLLGVSVP
jgi:hypothetical protein